MSTQYLLEERSIPVPRQLAAAIGLEEATVFQQLWYCLQNPNMLGKKDANNQKWIRNPIECRDAEKQQRAREHGKDIDWLSNFPFLSPYRIRRVFSKLEGLGLVISRKLRASKWDHCKYYTIDNSKLAELLKGLKVSICQFSTHPFVESQHIHLSSERKSYQNTFSNKVFQDQDPERDSEAFNTPEKEILTTEESASELPVDQKVFVEDLGCEQNCKTDKYSATAEFGESDLNKFKAQLEDLGKKLGRHSPLGWAFAIVQNLRGGKLSTYWDEFKAGIPLGTSEQQEWEIEPGVPCSVVKQCLEDHYLSKPGTTKQEAALQAGRSLGKPKQMQALWQSIKERVLFLKHEADRLSEIGVESFTVDPWMKPKPEISVTDFSEAISSLQGSTAPQLEGAVEQAEAENPYAITPESLEARERARSLLKNKYGKLTRAEEILAANIAEVEKMPAVKSTKVVIPQDYDDVPIPW